MAEGAAADVAAGAAAADAAATSAGTGDAYASRLRPDAPPAPDEDGAVSSGSRRVTGGVSGAGSARARNAAEADTGAGRVAPPLDLPPRPGHNTPNGSGSSAGTASGWSRGAGHSAGTGARARASSAGGSIPPARTPARPVDRGSAPPINGGGSRPDNGAGGFKGAAPAWPASGWPTAGPRQRSDGRPQRASSTPPPAEPAGQSGQSSNGGGPDEPRAMPFWLRPIRRDK